MTDTSKTKPARRFARTPKIEAPADGAVGTTPEPGAPGPANEQPATGTPPKPDSKIARVIALFRSGSGFGVA